MALSAMLLPDVQAAAFSACGIAEGYTRISVIGAVPPVIRYNDGWDNRYCGCGIPDHRHDDLM